MIKVWNGEYEINELPVDTNSVYLVLLEGITAINNIGMTGWVAYGTALGLYRDNKFITGDTDIDIEVIGNVGQEKLKSTLSGWGYELVRTSTDTEDGFVYQMCFKQTKSGILLDYQFLKEQETGYLSEAETSGVFTYPLSIGDKIKIVHTTLPRIVYGGNMLVTIPMIDPEWYLSYVYGSDWKTPVCKKESVCYFKEENK